jgi:hypothetical protein
VYFTETLLLATRATIIKGFVLNFKNNPAGRARFYSKKAKKVEKECKQSLELLA